MKRIVGIVVFVMLLLAGCSRNSATGNANSNIQVTILPYGSDVSEIVSVTILPYGTDLNGDVVILPYGTVFDENGKPVIPTTVAEENSEQQPELSTNVKEPSSEVGNTEQAAKVENTEQSFGTANAEQFPEDTNIEALPNGDMIVDNRPDEAVSDRESIDKINAELAKQHVIPVISITTEGGREVDSKEEYVPAVVDIVGCEESYLLSAKAGVRVRGNSTAGTEVKPYRIKFESKQNMLGLHDGKKYKSWVLLKADWNVCSDYTGLNLAKVVLDDYVYSSDCTFVQVYINAQYKGLYTLCEQNQVNKGRVELKEADLVAESPEAPDEIGYFLEIDNNPSNENPYFKMDYNEVTVTDYAGTTRKMCTDSITIKSDISTTEQRDFISNYMKGVFTILYEACCNNKAYMLDDSYQVVSAEGIYTPEQAVETVIDVDSFVNMTILYELTQDYDVGAGSFFFAVDFSKDALYKKLTCVAPWDFNWGYEEDPTKNFYACAWLELLKPNWDRSNIWLIVPMTADWYQQRVYARWQELSAGKELDMVLQSVENDVNGLATEVGDQAWRIDCGKKVVDFVRKRIEFLDKSWK